MKVISLYDYTGEALKPWAEAGYECFAFDIQHDPHEITKQYFPHPTGSIEYVHANLHDLEVMKQLIARFTLLPAGEEVAFVMAFPVCTDMAVSGAAHFANKRAKNPNFQREAANYAEWCAMFAEQLRVPYFVENPVSVLSTLWRKPDYSFHPYEYGGYIGDDEAKHPTWPEYIAPYDAYSKKTCLWSGKGFIMPETDEVGCQSFGSSSQHRKLGGKSMKTKNIRSATPRGFARAVFLANGEYQQ